MRVLFCPLASHGFVYPAIAVAEALRRRGHTVAFATGPAFTEVLRDAEIERIPRGEGDGVSFQIGVWHHPLSAAMQVKHLEYALSRFAPDVLVSNPLSLGALIVRERARLPLALLGFAAHLWPAAEEPLTQPSRSAVEAQTVWRHADMMRHFNEARRLFKLEPSAASCRESPMLGDLFMLQSIPELTPAVEDLPERVHLVGSCLWEPPASDELRDWLLSIPGSGAPLIYVHHGRSFDSPSFWEQVVEGLGGRRVRVAAAIGRMDRDAPVLPENFFVRPHLCQGAVLRHAQLAISGGNTTPVLGALTHGVPSLLLPGGGEQRDVAAQVERVGAARILRLGETTAESLGRAAEEALSDADLARSAQAQARAFSRVHGPERAALLIEHLGKTSSPVLRRDVLPDGELDPTAPVAPGAPPGGAESALLASGGVWR
jgi:MGT family glycosyltransferase